MRSADGLGAHEVYLSGYTPYPVKSDDERLPHLREKIDKQISKTALGAEKTVAWEHVENLENLVNELKKDGFLIAALEQTPESKNLADYKLTQNVALIVGSEVEGIDKDSLELCDTHLEIPMLGAKESLNVSVAAAIALYHLKFAR